MLYYTADQFVVLYLTVTIPLIVVINVAFRFICGYEGLEVDNQKVAMSTALAVVWPFTLIILLACLLLYAVSFFADIPRRLGSYTRSLVLTYKKTKRS